MREARRSTKQRNTVTRPHAPRLALKRSGCVSFLPKVTYLESLALMKSADLLLNIDASADISVFLPSKLVDYVGAARPIFGITPPGTSATLVRELGGWVADPKRPPEIADQLMLALSDIEQWRSQRWGDAAVQATYEVKSVVASFEEMIAELAREDASEAPRECVTSGRKIW